MIENQGQTKQIEHKYIKQLTENVNPYIRADISAVKGKLNSQLRKTINKSIFNLIAPNAL